MHTNRLYEQNGSTPLGYYNSVALSGSGQYHTVVQRAESDDATCASQAMLQISWDYGKTYHTRLVGLNLVSVAMSQSGQFQTAVVQANTQDPSSGPGYIYTSSDFGAMWSQNTSAPSNGWYGVAMSNCGRYQLAVPNSYKSPPSNGFIYSSWDYGQTWISQQGPGEQLWLVGAMDASGRTQVAVVFGSLSEDLSIASPGNIYISRDFGYTWNAVPSLSDFFTTVAISSCGRYLTAGAQNCNFAPAIPKPLYISHDGGVNWMILNSNTDNWLNVAMTADGRYQCALSYLQEPQAVTSGFAYQSFDYGMTWERITTLPQNYWTSNSLSDDGCYHTLTATLCGAVFKKVACHKKS